MRYVNDFRILLCTWVHELKFPFSLQMVREAEVLSGIISGLSGIPRIKEKAEAKLAFFLLG
jgi:hypothetical protein